jgi:hypothetical protein
MTPRRDQRHPDYVSGCQAGYAGNGSSHAPPGTITSKWLAGKGRVLKACAHRDDMMWEAASDP